MSRADTHTRRAEVVRGWVALAVLVVLLAGVPAGLVAAGGSPIPHELPSWDQVSATLTQPDTGNALFLTVIKVIGWAAWFLFGLITLTEAACYRRGRPPRRLPAAIRPMQHMARDLVAMTALIMTATASTIGAASSADSTAVAYTTTAGTHQPVTGPPTALPRTVQGPARAAHRPPHVRSARQWRTRTIKRGDTLWAIARTTIGAGAKYPVIFNASKHLAQPHGLPPLTEPGRIYPGQRIKIPATDQTRRQPEPPARPPAQSQRRPHPHQPTVTQSPVMRPRATPPSPTGPGHVTAPPPGTHPAAPPPPPGHPRPAATSPFRTTPAPAPADSAGPRHETPVTVNLPTGAYLGLGLATAISIALAATRLHRRRRRAPATEWPNPTEPAAAAPVAKARKAHLDTYTDRGTPPPADTELIGQDATTPPPTHITAGTRDATEIRIELSGLNLGLTGPGAPAVARALMTELLAKSSRYRVEVIIPEPDATALLTGSGINIAGLDTDDRGLTGLTTSIPGLIVPRSVQAAITHLESEFIHRARLMETIDQPDVLALRAAEPGEPLPVIIVISAVPPSSEALQAILALSAPYCVGALMLGPSPAGTTLYVAADGTVTDATGPAADTWTGSRLFHLTAADAAEMLQVVRTAHGAPEPAAATAPSASPTHTPSAPGRTGLSSLAPPSPARVPDRAGDVPPPQPTGRQPTGPPDPDTSRPVRLSLLGHVRVESGGEPIITGLRRITRDLLTYLALHPDGITREQGVDALTPDRDLQTGTTMFHTAVGNARKALREATGLREPMFIIHAGGRYRLDRHLIDVDLWHLQATLNHAHNADTDADRLNALRLIPGLYTAELAEDLTFEWAETERETLRRHATDALSQLAQLSQKNDPDQALAALEHALNHDPYAEPLYRDLMRLQAQTGRPDAVRRTHTLLKNRLADLDTEPDEETHQLLLALLRPSSGKATPALDPRSASGRRDAWASLPQDLT